ncbi:MAG: hypothetical protein AB9903_24305 [Vulcanimicrobiota bacterium]
MATRLTLAGDNIVLCNKGRLDASINQFQKQTGSRRLECAIKAIEGEKLPPYIYIKPELVTKERLGLPFQ